jgi:hypothetical protein
MRMMAVVLPVLVAGCATMERPVAARGPCVIDERVKMRFAGVKFRERMRPEIERATHAAMSRVLRPDDAATMDFRPERLNILLDDGGQIDGLRCG